MSALDLIAARADAALPVTCLTLYACTTPGCQHDALRGTTADRVGAARKLGTASRPAVLAAGLPVREVREYLGGPRGGRPLHLPARRCAKGIGGCGEPRLRLARTAQPEDPVLGRAAIRGYLQDHGIEPRGL